MGEICTEGLSKQLVRHHDLQVDDLAIPRFILYRRRIENLDDVWMPEAAIGFDLPHHLLDALLSGRDKDFLQRVKSPRRRVSDEVDEREASFTQKSLNLV